MDLFGGSVIVILLILDTTIQAFMISVAKYLNLCVQGYITIRSRCGVYEYMIKERERERAGGGVDAFKVQKKI